VSAAATGNPDAELIAVCEQHTANRRTVNDLHKCEEGDPEWIAYSKTRAVICAANPRTIDGILAKPAWRRSRGRERTTHLPATVTHGPGT
jgi:hypothetical protein